MLKPKHTFRSVAERLEKGLRNGSIMKSKPFSLPQTTNIICRECGPSDIGGGGEVRFIVLKEGDTGSIVCAENHHVAWHNGRKLENIPVDEIDQIIEMAEKLSQLMPESEYSKLKKMIDRSFAVARGSATPDKVIEVMQMQTRIAERINAAEANGKLTEEQQRSLLAMLAKKVDIGQ